MTSYAKGTLQFRLCAECHIPLRPESLNVAVHDCHTTHSGFIRGRLCDVCSYMFAAAATKPGLWEAEVDYLHENERLKRLKKGLMK